MMAKNSKIQWTTHTFNPWRGCTKVSAGCANCYAETQSKRNPGTLGVWGPNGSRVVASESMWREPLKWNRQASHEGQKQCPLSFPHQPHDWCNGNPEGKPFERHRVFCASLADVFEVDSTIPAAARSIVHEARLRLLTIISQTPHLDWLLLTKRPQHVLEILDRCVRFVVCPHEAGSTLAERWLNVGPPANVWIGTSVEDQAAADERMPHLLKIPAKVRFLSCEPLLGPVDLKLYLSEGVPTDAEPFRERADLLHWIIVGGESGPNARVCNVEWIRDIVRQCKEAGVPVFVKQLGSRPRLMFSGPDWKLIDWPRGTIYDTAADGLTLRLKDSKGGDPDEWPEDLRVREVPIV